MSTAAINYLNIGLMILSCGIAFVIPFDLFLFSYAVLGPLHYLTEISWLHKRKYFVLGKKDYLLLLVLGVLIFVVSYLEKITGFFVGYEEGVLAVSASTRQSIRAIMELSTTISFLAFGSALLMILVKNRAAKFVGYALLILLGLTLAHNEQTGYVYYVLFAVFLPTLIHVFIFTGAFILYGALKSKSRSGYLSILVFVLCALSFFVIRPDSLTYTISDYVQKSYDSSFLMLNFYVFKTFMPDMASKHHIYFSEAGFMITRFIAFAYTYHYLNWFSKTSVIKWHKVPRRWLAGVLVIWIISVGLYAYNYETGLVALYFLSFLHVYMEFPLNWISFRGIGQEMGQMVPRIRTAAATSRNV